MNRLLTDGIQRAVNWIGGWGRFIALIVVVVAVVVGLLWERQRGVPVPPQAQNVASDINSTIARQTTFTFPGAIDEVRAFYQQELPRRGWRYCGTQATAHCTNLVALNDGSAQLTDVYRRADDQNNRGRTIEIMPIQRTNGQVFVTVFETREQ